MGILAKFIEIVNRSRLEVHVSELKRTVAISVSFTSGSLHSFLEGLWVLVFASSAALCSFIEVLWVLRDIGITSEIECASVFSIHRIKVSFVACVLYIVICVVYIDISDLFNWLTLFLVSAESEEQILKQILVKVVIVGGHLIY